MDITRNSPAAPTVTVPGDAPAPVGLFADLDDPIDRGLAALACDLGPEALRAVARSRTAARSN